jgi:phosphonate transport system substrate-binding protein
LSAGVLCLATLGLRPSASAAAASVDESSPTAPVRFAFSKRMFSEVNENDAQAAMKAWGQALSSERKIPFDPTVRILTGTEAIAAAVRDQIIDVITLPTDEYWEVSTLVPLGSIVFGTNGNQITEQYVLLVRGDSEIQRLADLRGRSLVVFQNTRTILAPTWLEIELLQHQLGRAAPFWGRVTESTKLLRVILPVFFRQADACLVSLRGFETMVELNPQIGRQLKILAKSEPVIPALLCFRGDYPAAYREKIIKEAARVNETPAGRQTLALFQAGHLLRGDPASLASTCTLLELHRRLCAAAPDAQPGDSALRPVIAVSGRD